MSQNITTFDPLISCTTYKWEVLIKKIDLETFIKIPDSDFIIFEWWVSHRKNQIESVSNANSAQYFEYNVLPWLSNEYKKHYKEVKDTCPKDISHDVLLNVLKTRYEREKYEEEVNKPMTQEEKEQRKKSIELITRKLTI